MTVKSVIRSRSKLEVTAVIAASSAATHTGSEAGTGALPGAGEAMVTVYNACGGN